MENYKQLMQVQHAQYMEYISMFCVAAVDQSCGKPPRKGTFCLPQVGM